MVPLSRTLLCSDPVLASYRRGSLRMNPGHGDASKLRQTREVSKCSASLARSLTTAVSPLKVTPLRNALIPARETRSCRQTAGSCGAYGRAFTPCAMAEWFCGMAHTVHAALWRAACGADAAETGASLRREKPTRGASGTLGPTVPGRRMPSIRYSPTGNGPCQHERQTAWDLV